MIFHTDPRQAALDRAIAGLAAELGESEDVIRQNISHETLRLIKPIPATGGPIRFNPVEGTDANIAGEEKLNNNEVFVAYEVGLGIHRFTGTDINAAAANIAEQFPATFPDPDVFTFTKTGESAEATQLMRVFQGRVEFENGRKKHSVIHTSRCLYIPSAADAEAALHEYGPSEAARGMTPILPQCYIDGGDRNTLTLQVGPGTGTNLDGSTSAGTTANTASRNAVTLWLNGFRYTKPSGSAKCENPKV